MARTIGEWIGRIRDLQGTISSTEQGETMNEEIAAFLGKLTPAQKVEVVTVLIGEFQQVYEEAQAFARKVLPK